MTEPTRISQPTIRLTEVASALSIIPKRHRQLLGVALSRLGDDHGWDEEIRGFCLVLSGCITDLANGTTMRDQLDALDGITTTNGSLAWLVEVDISQGEAQ